jgi:hypothetical protein
MANNTKSIKDLIGAEPELSAPTPAQGNAVQQANRELLNAEARKKRLLQHYRNEEKVPMYLSPMYRPYFGNVMQVSLNGISIFFKVDGSVQKIPKDFADEITARRMAIDAILTKQSKMADISKNYESSPGELDLI